MRRDHGHSGRGDIGAERVEAAMGDVENFENAEYQRQPQCNDEKPGSLNQPVENNCQKQVHCAVFMQDIAGEGGIQDAGSNADRMSQSGQGLAARASRSRRSNLASDAPAPQLHLAPAMPPLIQSIDFTPGGGLTHSAGKYWMSTRSTRFRSGLYLVRLMAIGWIAWWPSASFI